MDGREREKGGGREICMFFLYFCFWFQIQERIRRGNLWLGDANLLILFLHRDIGIRAGCRQEKCHAKAKGKDRAFDWPMDQGLKCKSAKFFPV